MGFGPPEGDPEVWAALEVARERKAMTFALPGLQGLVLCCAGSRGCVSFTRK